MSTRLANALRREYVPVEDLSPYLDGLLTRLQSKQFNPQTCDAFIENLYLEISEIDPHFLNPVLAKEHRDTWLAKLFSARVALISKWSEFDHTRLQIKPQSVRTLRKIVNAFRLLEDRLIIWQNYSGKAKLFTGDHPMLMTTAKDKTVRVRSGDLFVSRADPFFSSFLSQMAEDQGMLSHVVLVYFDAPIGTEMTIDEAVASPNAFIVEAHGCFGATTFPFGEYIKRDYARVTQFRSILDSKQAHAAAHSAYRLVTDFAENSRKISGRKKGSANDQIPYDFKLDLNDRSTLYCAELAKRAYENVELNIPTYPSQVRNNPLLAVCGVSAHKAFAPSDLEIEPHFQLLTEWRDYSKLKEITMVDFAFSAVISWAEEKHYFPYLRSVDIFIGNAMWQIRQWDLGFTKAFQKHLPARHLSYSYIIHRVGTALLNQMRKYVDQYRALNGGHIPTNEDLRAELERFRAEDAAAHAAGKTSFFHRDYRSNKS